MTLKEMILKKAEFDGRNFNGLERSAAYCENARLIPIIEALADAASALEEECWCDAVDHVCYPCQANFELKQKLEEL